MTRREAPVPTNLTSAGRIQRIPHTWCAPTASSRRQLTTGCHLYPGGRELRAPHSAGRWPVHAGIDPVPVARCGLSAIRFALGQTRDGKPWSRRRA